MAANNGSINDVEDLLFLDHKWHTTSALKEVGGPHALRRLRELRAQGRIIITRRLPGSKQWEYRAV